MAHALRKDVCMAMSDAQHEISNGAPFTARQLCLESLAFIHKSLSFNTTLLKKQWQTRLVRHSLPRKRRRKRRSRALTPIKLTLNPLLRQFMCTVSFALVVVVVFACLMNDSCNFTFGYSVSSDAPALSEESTAILESAVSTQDASQWDEQQLPSKTSVICKDKEILDVKTLSDATEEASNSIQERLKLEETKAALQAARDGMEREAQRLKEQEETKEATESTSSSGRFSAAAQSVAGGGTAGKSWVPPHLRAGTAASLTRRTGGGMSSFQKVDTKDETLFPDLNTADKILEQEKKTEAYKPPKKTPGSWAAARASGTLKKAPAAAPAPAPIKVEEPVEEVTTEEEAPKPAPVPAPSPKLPAATPTKSMPVKKKKKKKDLSTFKPSASQLNNE